MLFDDGGNYTGDEFGAIGGFDHNGSRLYGDDSQIFWLTDADGKIQFETVERYHQKVDEDGNQVWKREDTGEEITIGSHRFGDITSSHYLYREPARSFYDAKTKSISGAYLKDEYGEPLYWLQYHDDGWQVYLDSDEVDENGDPVGKPIILSRTLDLDRPLFGEVSGFDTNGSYQGDLRDGALATDESGEYWATDINGTFITDANGDYIVVQHLYNPKLAFPIMTNETESGIRRVEAGFHNEHGHHFNLSDTNLDGIMSTRLSESTNSGTYQLTSLTVRDSADSENWVTYYGTYGEDGGQVSYRDGINNTSRSDGAHNLEFTNYTIEILENSNDGTNDIQTDFVAPELTSISFAPQELPIVISGTDEIDLLFGSMFADVLNGLAGDDTIDAGAGDDHIKAGIGNDTLTGGEGADLFEFTVGFGSDVITDFELGVDKISILDENGTQLTLAEYSDLGFSNIEGGGIKITHEDLDGDITLEDLTGGPSLDFFEII